MLLYHGTSEAVARLALTEGLKPRCATGLTGNWEHTVQSGDDRVYLTAAYAPYFAFVAVPEGGHERWAIIEVDTDLLAQGQLLPDEDFLEQGSRGQEAPDWLVEIGFESNWEMTERTEWFRDNAMLFQSLWRESVTHLGNAAYRGNIPPEAITRVVLFEPQLNAAIFQSAVDPSISLLNYKFTGAKYRALTQWMMGDEISVEQFYGEGGMGAAFMTMMPKEQLESVEALLADRRALTFLKGSGDRT